MTMKMRYRDLQKLGRNALTTLAAIGAVMKWRRRSRAKRALYGSARSIRRHPVRTALGAIAIGMAARTIARNV
jgi:hypothetical protein